MTPTPRRPVTKTVGSVTFEDPYDWLQHDSDEALAWQWEQDACAEHEARAWLHFESLKTQIKAAGVGSAAPVRTPPRLRGGRWFWLAAAPDQGVRMLWTATEATDPGRPVFAMADHVAPEDAQSAVAIWYEPSPGGDRVAVAIDSHGGLDGQWHFIDVATGKALRAPMPAAAYNRSFPGWLPDGSGVYLHGRDTEGRHCVRFVSMEGAAPERLDVTFGVADLPSNVSGLTLEVSPDGRWVIALAGPHERIAYMIGDTRSGVWRRFLPDHCEGEVSGAWLDADTYVARAHSDDFPRGRIVAIPAATSTDPMTWRVVEPQTEAVLQAVGVSSGKIVIADILHVSARFRVLDPVIGAELIAPTAAPAASYWTMLSHRFEGSDALTFDYSTFTQSSGVYRLDLVSGELTTLSPPSERLEGIEVTQRFARSRDGVRVPYFVVRRSDVPLDQPQPALVTGYGGFNTAILPGFLGHLAPFVRAGGSLIHANLRGGGEYGKRWHEGGRLACKWNTFLDLFAVAEDVVTEGIASRGKLAMHGYSNGGLLAGAAIVHRPDLWRVVVPDVPLLDMLEPLLPGPGSDPIRAVFFEDYGDPQDPVMSKILNSYSPYHNVRDGVAYPAVFQVFGEKDGGSPSFHGRKFTAALQHASSSDRRLLLRVWRDTGHTIFDANVMLLQKTEWLGFVMAELGMTPI